MTDISIVGGGNLAQHLLLVLESRVSHVYTSRRDWIAGEMNLEISSYEGRREIQGSIVFLAIPDRHIRPFSEGVQWRDDQLVVHLSGSVDMDQIAHGNRGVFYPLQSFSKGRDVDWGHIPILTEASNKESATQLSRLADSLSAKVYPISSEKRREVHLAAVVVSNFTIFLHLAAKDYLESKQLDPELIESLLMESVHKSLELGPESALTGPARRGDLPTVKSHLGMLRNEPEFQELYQTISANILSRFGHEDI